MLLSEIHDQLCAAELSKLFEGDGDQLKPESLPKINSIIQAGIADLNKQFTIRENELLLSPKLGKHIYELTNEHTVSSGNPMPYIMDSMENPFLGDIMQILRVTDDQGFSMWLNTDVPYRHPSENLYGVRPHRYTHEGINLLAYDTIKFHKDHSYGDLLIHYKARLRPLDFSTPADELVIDLPDHYMNALVLYVASRKYNPMGAETIGKGMFHEGNNYWSKYLAEVAELKANLGSISSMGETTNFYRNGWV